MKGYLLQMDNERGLYLPFVLFITLILFSTVTTMVAVYKNEKLISYQLWELTKADTIVEMTKQKFIQEDALELNDQGEISYTLPSGDVYVEYDKIDDYTYSLFITIETDNAEPFFIKSLVIMS